LVIGDDKLRGTRKEPEDQLLLAVGEDFLVVVFVLDGFE